MMYLKESFLLAAIALSTVKGQTYILTGCHFHGDTEYCKLPNGAEVPIPRTQTALQSSPTSAISNAPATVSVTPTSTAFPALVTGCHSHGSEQFCLDGDAEWQVLTPPTITPLPTIYSGCHRHDADVVCFGPSSTEVVIALEAVETGTTTAAPALESSHSGKNCHFHAGVEHCTNEGESESAGTKNCNVIDREYDIPLRIGLLFVILAGSALAVFSPVLLARFTKISLHSIVFIILKQFGTGIIISTALVHLLTHSELMFRNECLGGLDYEATAAAIAMAGIFLSFLIEFFGSRLILSRQTKNLDTEQHQVSSPAASDKSQPLTHTHDTSLGALGHAHGAPLGGVDNHFSIVVMEVGIVFHSILIGITLVVAGDSFFRTLFVVILFHQMFEGLALGTRIATLPAKTSVKLIMGLVFALITPIGMAIGIGAIKQFNGNSPNTIVALGTLDALSAGILLWVGLVQMWSHDWLHGDMAKASMGKVAVGLMAMVTGMVIMSVLGKWA